MYSAAIDLYKDCYLKVLHSPFKFWVHVSEKVKGNFL